MESSYPTPEPGQVLGGKTKQAELPDMCTPGIAAAATAKPKRA